LQHRQSLVILLVGNRAFAGRDGARLPHVALGGPMARARVAGLMQGDDEKKLPQFIAGWDGVMPGRGSAEKCAEHGLHDVLGVEPGRQIGAALRFHQGV
jgi:hypothetical protein